MFDAESNKSLLPDAVELCHACVVKVPCLAYGMAHREEEGIYGGLTTKNRMSKRRHAWKIKRQEKVA